MNQFDDRISNVDGISTNTKLGIHTGSSRKMGMGNRNDMYDLRPDAVQMEKMKSKQVANIDNILNEDIDHPYDDNMNDQFDQLDD